MRFLRGNLVPDDPINTADIPVRIARKASEDAAFVPKRITRLQFKRALRQLNRYAQFVTAIGAASDDLKDYWADARFINRNDAEVDATRALMGFNNNQVDNAFRIAKTFPDT